MVLIITKCKQLHFRTLIKKMSKLQSQIKPDSLNQRFQKIHLYG